MKIIPIAFSIFAALVIAVSLSASNQPPADHVAPTLRAELQPGQPRPSLDYCREASEYYSIYNCSCENNVYYCPPDIQVIVENGKIVRVYLFPRKGQVITAGQLINELGDPDQVRYSRQGAVAMRWGEYSVVVLIEGKFSPTSKVLLVGWGKMKNTEKFTAWRGFKNR